MMNTNKSPAGKLAKYLIAFPLVFMLVAANSVYAQKTQPQKKANSSDEIFTVVEKQPRFVNGVNSMLDFVKSEMKYPEIAKENGIQGRVIVNFVIEKDGSVTSPKIVRGVDPSLDKEAIRIINTMAKWIPGEQNGKLVRVRYTLPINFRLDETTGNGNADVAGAKIIQEKVSEQDVSSEIFVVVENQPEFPGGTSAMMKFLSDSIRYPVEAAKNKVQGRVIANFVVTKDGSINEVNIVRGVDPLLDAEAVRVIKSMPAWKPGTQRGKPVNVRFTLPIVFGLQKEANDEAMEKLKNKGPVAVYDEPIANPDKGFYKYLAQNIKYPVIAQENGITGFINASYMLNEKGEISNVKIVKGVDPSLDNEVIRVIEAMPNDVALSRTGETFSGEHAISFLFRLQNENTKGGQVGPSADVVVVGYGVPDIKNKVKKIE